MTFDLSLLAIVAVLGLLGGWWTFAVAFLLAVVVIGVRHLREIQQDARERSRPNFGSEEGIW